MSRREEVRVPDIGDFENVEIVEVAVRAGDTVAAEAPLITLETDKASMEVPAPFPGRVAELKVGKGDRVSKGSLIAVLEVDGAAAPAAGPKAQAAPAAPPSRPQPAPPAAAPARAPVARPPATLPPIDEASFGRAHASPSVRKFARELGVNLASVRGTGPKDRVLQDDVKAYVKAILTGQVAGPAGGGLPRVPVVDYAAFGPIESQPLSRIQKISGPRLQAAWLNIPHVTQHDEADIGALEARRQALKGAAEARGMKLTPLAFVIKATVIALQQFPVFNASLIEDGTALILKRYHHIGFAADTPQGLVVPVVRDADKKDLVTIAGELAELSARARAGKLTPDQMRGGTFTVSSLGGIGGTFFTPIVNAPEVAILGVGRSYHKPVWRQAAFAPQLTLPLSLSYDHRVIDGATGARFITFLVQVLADPARLEA